MGRLAGLWLVAIAAGVSSFGAVSAAPGSASLFGVDVGHPLALPACPLKRTPGILFTKETYVIDTEKQKSICWTINDDHVVPLQPPTDGGVKANFVIGQRPTYMSEFDFSVGVANGVVDSVTVFTSGIDRQDEVFAALVSKYGKPDKQQPGRWMNDSGAYLDVIHAQWQFSDGSVVTFDGKMDRYRDGVITALSPLEAAKRERLKKESQGPSL